MYALITGASSGIGREMSILLAKNGYDLIIVARREDRLKNLSKKLEHHYGVDVIVKEMDLSKESNCYKLHDDFKDCPIEILINNAGFGKMGLFEEIPLEEELKMIDINVKGLHILTKLFISTMDRGRILNVASIAGFSPLPIMATYGATKSYVLNLSRAINYELKKEKRDIHISVLCPGPVKTEFDQVADTEFALNYISAKECAAIALNGLMKKEEVIVPSARIKIIATMSKYLPPKIVMPVANWFQTRMKRS